MNFWYIEHYGACFRDDIDAKTNLFKIIKLVSQFILDLMHSRHKLL